MPGSLSPESRPFQYVIVRVVPRIDRGEQLNAGVVLYSGPLEFLAARVELDEARLRALAPAIDMQEVREHLAAIPLAAVGLLNPVIASLAMVFSSVSVISNALRLRRFRSAHLA